MCGQEGPIIRDAMSIKRRCPIYDWLHMTCIFFLFKSFALPHMTCKSQTKINLHPNIQSTTRFPFPPKVDYILRVEEPCVPGSHWPARLAWGREDNADPDENIEGRLEIVAVGVMGHRT